MINFALFEFPIYLLARAPDESTPKTSISVSCLQFYDVHWILWFSRFPYVLLWDLFWILWRRWKAMWLWTYPELVDTCFVPSPVGRRHRCSISPRGLNPNSWSLFLRITRVKGIQLLWLLLTTDQTGGHWREGLRIPSRCFGKRQGRL